MSDFPGGVSKDAQIGWSFETRAFGALLRMR
jgi:hypothetical protein